MPPGDSEFWNLLLQVLAAMATLATIVSVGWGIFTSLGPRLRVALRQGEDRTRFGDGDHAPWSYFFHLRVENRGRRMAKGACVKLTRINKPLAGGGYADEELGAPLRLQWAHSAASPCLKDIAPRDIESCNLGYLIQNQRFELDLCTRPWPPTFPGFVEAGGRMLVEVVAVADGARSEPLRLEVAWDGVWSDQATEMRKHLVISVYQGGRKMGRHWWSSGVRHASGGAIAAAR